MKRLPRRFGTLREAVVPGVLLLALCWGVEELP